MGCVASTVEEGAVTMPNKGIDLPKSTLKPLYVGSASDASPEELIVDDLRAIMTNCQTIPRGQSMHPICCLSELSMPFLIAPVESEDGTNVPYSFPIMATSRYEFGRVLALGSFEMLANCKADSNNDICLLENVLRWAGGPSPIFRTVLLYGLGDSVSQKLVELMTGLGFGLEVQQDGSIDYSKYVTIFAKSDLDDNEAMFKFLMSGGCLVVAPADRDSANRFALNECLGKMGVAFLEEPVRVKTDDELPVYKFSETFKELKKHRYPELLTKFTEMIEREDEVTNDLIHLMRCHMKLVRPEQGINCIDACDTVLQFLARHGFMNEQGEIVEYTGLVLLVCDMYKQFAQLGTIPVDITTPVPDRCNQYVEPLFHPVKVLHPGIYSTGLYLPAGCVTEVHWSTDIKELKLQIGCHTQSLAEKAPPWKRWPLVTVTYHLVGRSEIYSPFGGILYVVWEKELPKKETIIVHCSDVVTVPWFNVNRPELWEETKDSGCPIGEVTTKRLVYSVSADFLRSIEDLRAFAHRVDVMVGMLETSLGVVQGEEHRPYRVVFDVDLPTSHPVCDYPMVFKDSWMPHLFALDKPTFELFTFFNCVCTLNLSRLFGRSFAAQVAQCAVLNAFGRWWPGFSLPDWGLVETPIQKLLSDVTRDKGFAVYTTAMRKIRTYIKANPGNPTGLHEKMFLLPFAGSEENVNALLTTF